MSHCIVHSWQQYHSILLLSFYFYPTVSNRIWQQIDIDDMQFGLMKGKGTTDAILIVRQMHENKEALFWLCGFGEAFDRLPREVIRWEMHKMRVEELLASAVMSMYTGAKQL